MFSSIIQLIQIFLQRSLIKSSRSSKTIATYSEKNKFLMLNRQNCMVIATILLLQVVPNIHSVTPGFGECINGTLTFELITGYVYTSPADTVTMIPGVLHLSECLDYCRMNQTCSSLNFETGLCVLLSSSAQQRPFALTSSQFPVFTIYAHKICLNDMNSSCANSGWAFERVRGYELREHERRAITVKSRLECMQACVDEQTFTCRSINYEEDTKDCWLSDMNRHTININAEVRSKKYGPSSSNTDYLEYNCLAEPKKLCDFKPIEGKILKTVDSVYQNVSNIEECQRKCLSGPYKCHSYDFGDPSNSVCRTSHLDKISLLHIENPYIEIHNAVTFELQNCYDVNIQCRSNEMIAKVRSSKMFDGKVYAKRKPNNCMSDINESLEFEIRMGYNDLECDVQQLNRGQFMNDIIIQHHDMIVTTQDLGLNINCKYDLSNKSISNDVNLDIEGNLQPIGTHSAIVASPNITMKIFDQDGASVRSAKVGDSLVLRFEIPDISSPYELFVRELIAVDANQNSEFILIDVDGCPTDMTIMRPIERSGNSGQILETQFEAFKFPSSDVVQFKALITPCVSRCEPSNCSLSFPSGRSSQVNSYGKRRRRRAANEDSITFNKSNNQNKKPNKNVVVVESLSVSDKFSVSSKKKIEENDLFEIKTIDDDDPNWSRTSRIEFASPCFNVISVMVFALAFLICQAILLISWLFLSNRRRTELLLTKKSLYETKNCFARCKSDSSSLSAINDSKMLYSVPSRQNGYF